MSNDPNDTQGGSGQPGGSQPQGGAGGPQGGGQPPRQYDTGPGVGDIFNRPETKAELKIGSVFYAMVAIGLGIAALGSSLISGGTGGVGGLALSGAAAIGIALLLGPIIALVVGVRQADALSDQPGNLLYANAAVTAFVGTIVVYVIGLIIMLVTATGPATPNLGQVISNTIGPIIVAGIGSGVTAAGAAWAVTSIVPGPSQPQPQTGGQTPGR